MVNCISLCKGESHYVSKYNLIEKLIYSLHMPMYSTVFRHTAARLGGHVSVKWDLSSVSLVGIIDVVGGEISQMIRRETIVLL